MVMWGKGLGDVSHDGVGWGCVGGVFLVVLCGGDGVA